MENFIKFLSCFLLVFTLTACSKNQGIKTRLDNSNVETKVSIEQAKKIVDENKDLVIFDIRTKEEYDSGHIKSAILIPYDQINENIDFIKKYKDKEVLVYCKTGRRSSIAIKALIDNNYSKIYHMNEGISRWKYDLAK
ncbi:rhodanese-like domain-containing protein [Clostridium tetanomorphum]|uniref:Rhodanese-like domain-containing protein n=1 Tax=Clostridium tetanomorphum TaxID=1553 RepID=A0A923ECD2_CLOTT|nr:rhodanese-like domain-containing protein [Clostridium tetanomorphum]MBC2399322.1 rhodanese-like domain-containing protein [Clostridium tetanomorphum]NRZ98516.1 rhodanese-related sulfurtransferase [Clostridium tetanomorphum]